MPEQCHRLTVSSLNPRLQHAGIDQSSRLFQLPNRSKEMIAQCTKEFEVNRSRDIASAVSQFLSG